MADEKFYEQKLTKIIEDAVLAPSYAKNFIQAAEKKRSLIGTITAKLERLIGIGASEAETYINFYTGQFKPGKWMPHCLDPELKNLFAQLEAVSKEFNKYPFKSGTEATDYPAKKQTEMNQAIMEIRQIFGDDKARQIVARAKAAAIKITGINF